MTSLLLRHEKYNTHRINGVCLHALYFYLLSKACVAWNTDLVSNHFEINIHVLLFYSYIALTGVWETHVVCSPLRFLHPKYPTNTTIQPEGTS